VLSQGGLEIETLLPYGEVDRPRTLADLGWLLQRPHKIVRSWLSAILPVNLTNQFVFICKRASALSRQSYYPMLPR
jgi:hypothetical protein